MHIPRFPGEQLASDSAAKAATGDAAAAPTSSVDNHIDTNGMTEEEAEEALSKEFRSLLNEVTRAQVDKTDIRCPHPVAAERMRQVRAPEMSKWQVLQS